MRLGDLKRLLSGLTILWFWDPFPRVPIWKRDFGCSKLQVLHEALLAWAAVWEAFMLGKRTPSMLCHRERLRFEWRDRVFVWSTNGSSVSYVVCCRDLGREKLCCVSCACYSWKGSALWALWNKRDRGVQLVTSFHVNLEVFWDHQQSKLFLPLTHWENIGPMLSVPEWRSTPWAQTMHLSWIV